MPQPRLLSAPLALATALALSTLAGTAPPAHAQLTATARSIALPAQPLGTALNELARQAGLQLLVQPELLAGKQAPAVSGTLTPRQALDRLLAGSGLVALVNGNEVVVRRESAAAGQADTALAAVTVKAQAERNATSEGTGSYAAQAASVYKGAKSLREIPQSISVITRQQIEDQNLSTVQEALAQATGVRLTGYDGQESPQVRGFDMSTQADGAPIQSGGTGNNTLVQYDRVEVLRGPSALLSGTGEPGGVVNYVRKRPQAEFALSGSARLGSWNRYGADVDVGGPLSADGRLRGRGVAYHESQDSFYDMGFSRYALLFGVLEYDITPVTTLGLSATYGQRDWIVNWGLPRYTDGGLPGREAFVGSSRPSSHEAPELSVDLVHRFDNGWQAKLLYNHTRASIDQYSFYNAAITRETGLAAAGTAGHLDELRNFDSFDGHATGPFTLFGRTHELTVGYNIARRDYHYSQSYTANRGRAVLSDHDFTFDPVSTRSQNVVEQSGFYGTARFKLADTLTAIAGGRWSNYDNKTRALWPAPGAWTVSTARTRSEFTPYGGLVWDLQRDLTWYASYADTFVPQTQYQANGRVIDPRVGWQAETGLKGAFLDGRLNASVAVFHIRDTNRSMVDNENTGCPGSTAGTCYVNAGEVESQGWEAELSGRPLPGWDISAGYTYNRTKYLRDTSAANVGATFSAQTPAHLFKLWSQYRVGDWTVGGGAHVQSRIYSGVYRQGGYATVSAKLGWQASRSLNLSLMLDNLFDRSYLRQIGSAGFNNFYGAPRSALLSARWTY